MRTKLILVGLFGLVLGVSAQRTRTSIDEGWLFELGNQNLAQSLDYDDSSWRKLNVPHDWSIEGVFNKTNAHQNAWLPGGIGWYRKTIELSEDDASRFVELQFDGIYKHATVWVNGEKAGTQYDGYTSFYLDITPYVKAGKNVIAVQVDNSVQPNCRWYTGSGIYRHVWLTVKDKVHVENWGVAITTPAVTQSEAVVKIETEIAFKDKRYWQLELKTEILDADGKMVAEVSSQHEPGVMETLKVEHQLSVLAPERWSIDTPNLYTAVSRVLARGKIVDECRSTFGIRDIRFDAKKGFFLNGENIKMKGVCLHVDAGPLGNVVPEEVWEHRLIRLKESGCNAIRTAHNTAAPEFMDLCDRLGFLVMDEFADKWDDPVMADPYFHSEWKKNYRQTIRRDRNHPSVMIWSVGNENHAPGSHEQTSSLEAYCNFVRSIDSTRPVVSGMERGLDMDPDKKVDEIIESTQHMDLIGMNYGLQWSQRIANRNPGKAFVSTESCFYYGSTEEERWAMTARPAWFDVEEQDSNIGLFLWSGIKYLGEIPGIKKKENPDSWPNIFCWPGAFLDSAAFRMPMSYYYESLWSDQPMVYVGVYDQEVPHNKRWGVPFIHESWNHAEGTELDLVTYSNCEYVELQLNGKRIATQKRSDFSNGKMNWYTIPYQSGELKAVGFNKGKPASEFILKTAQEPAKVQLSVCESRGSLIDVVLVEVQLLDARGAPVKHAELELEFTVEGGEVLALDNGALTALDSMKETRIRSTHQGRCLVVIKRERDAVAITVKGDGLVDSKVKIP